MTTEPTTADCLTACRAHRRGNKRFREHVTYARAYFATARMGTPTECAKLAKEAGLEYALMLLIAQIVWRLWQAYYDRKTKPGRNGC